MLGNNYQNMLMISHASDGQIPINKECFMTKISQKTRSILFVYENGQIEKPSYSPLYGCDDDVYGKLQYIKFQPEDSDR